MGVRVPAAASGQLELLSASQRDLLELAAPTASARTQAAVDECGGGDQPTVDCPVGCRGTTSCLCGQGELSDDPVWIEND